MIEDNYKKRKNIISDLGSGPVADVFLDCLREVIEDPKYTELRKKIKEIKEERNVKNNRFE